MTISSTQSQGRSHDREYNIVVYGTTGFTGRLIVDYLTRYAGQTKMTLVGRGA